MPTIFQLPVATAVTASDLIPISQGGSAHAVSLGALLAQTQPAIIVGPPSLLGRYSVGAGGPDTIAIGDGLSLSNGTLSADIFNSAMLPIQTTLSAGDQIVVINTGTAQLIGFDQVREVFTAGPNITIDESGVISAAGPGDNSGYNLTELAQVAALGANDLVAVSQAGQGHSITYSNFIDGVTIDQVQLAAPASDSDSFWIAQGNNVILRQTLGALWQWVLQKLSSWYRPVFELSANTTLDSVTHNNAILICSAPIVISVPVMGLRSGFSCELINTGAGAVAFSNNIIASNGSTVLLGYQCCTIFCFTYSGGNTTFASVNSGSLAAIAPGEVTNVAASVATYNSITLAWSIPITGGAASVYTIQDRVSGTTSWSPGVQISGATTYTIEGLQSATSYDLMVTASNSAGIGPASGVITAATVTEGPLPAAPTNVVISSNVANGMMCSWTVPVSGGTGLTYNVQYRITGQTLWNSAANNLSATSFTLTNLASSTSYDVQVTASNSVGSGPSSVLVVGRTAAPSGAVTSISWQLVPTGSYVHASGAIGVNAHVNPSTAQIQFGFSTSLTIPPTTWDPGVFVNSDLWGQYVQTPASPGSWYVWAAGTDGSAATVYATSFVVT